MLQLPLSYGSVIHTTQKSLSFFIKVSIMVIVSLASLFANSLVVCKVCLTETGTLTIPRTALS